MMHINSTFLCELASYSKFRVLGGR